MKYIQVALFIILSINTCNSQNSDYIKYIDSFKKEERANIILKFGRIVQVNNQMTKEEALAFVYKGDSTKLFCNQNIFNMETEKVEGISRDLYLPNKCIRLDMGNYFLIAYSSYQCNNPNEKLKILLTLSIINKKYEKKDELLVYKRNEYESELTGLLNPINGQIFVIGNINNETAKQAFIYKINNIGMQFEPIKEENNITQNTDDLIQMLDILGWKEIFMN
jgi:hypothetical protein